eukprot:3892660-Prymnesium_polylepis.1
MLPACGLDVLTETLGRCHERVERHCGELRKLLQGSKWPGVTTVRADVVRAVRHDASRCSTASRSPPT